MRGTFRGYFLVVAVGIALSPGFGFCEFHESEFSESPPVGIEYSYDVKTLPLATKGDFFRVRSTAFGFRVEVGFLDLIVFQRNSQIQLFGRDSHSIQASAHFWDRRDFDYVEIPVNDILDRVDYVREPGAVVTIRDGDAEVRLPADRVRRHLSQVAVDRNYRVPLLELARESHHGKTQLKSAMFSFQEPIDLGPLARGDQYSAGAPPFGIDYLELLELLQGMALTYEDVIRQYLENIEIPHSANVSGTVEMEVDASLDISKWDFDLNSQEASAMVAFPLNRIPFFGRGIDKLGGQLEVLAGVGQKDEYAVFRVSEVVANVNAHVKGEVETNFYDEDGNVTHTFREEVDTYQPFELPIDLTSSPFWLESPTKSYRLVLIGLGYHREGGTQFEILGSFRSGNDLDRLNVRLVQPITSWLTLKMYGQSQQIATQAYFTQTNIPSAVLKERDINNLNEDVEQGRDYIFNSEFAFGVDIGRNVRAKIAELNVVGPSLWYEGGIETDVRGWLLSCSVLKSMYFVPGINSAIRFSTDRLPQLFQDIEAESENLTYDGQAWLDDGRRDELEYRLGIGYRMGRAAIRPSIDYREEKIRAWNVTLSLTDTNIPFLGSRVGVDAFLQKNIELKDIQGAIRLNVFPSFPRDVQNREK